MALHNRVYASRVYNFQGARLTVPSSLHLSFWRSKLQDYYDYTVCDFLEFGWPIGFDYSSPLSTSHARNHKGATDFSSAIDSYLASELSRGAIIGPFSSTPFSCPIALNTVPKPNTSEHQIILDRSWPTGSSVNDGIPKGIYLSQQYRLVYLTIDTIADCVSSLGRGCLLYKHDLKWAYRQFPVDPFDYPLLGYQWQSQLYSMLCYRWD